MQRKQRWSETDENELNNFRVFLLSFGSTLNLSVATHSDTFLLYSLKELFHLLFTKLYDSRFGLFIFSFSDIIWEQHFFALVAIGSDEPDLFCCWN